MKVICLLFLISTFSLGAAQSGEMTGIPEGQNGNCSKLADLLAFIANETAYTPMRKCPELVAVKQIKLRVSRSLKNIPLHEEPLAVFIPGKFQIVLGPEIDPSTPLGSSYLLHELVHAHQYLYKADTHAPCLGQLEGEAYHVQADFLRTHGLMEEAVNVEVLGLLKSACAHSYHPWSDPTESR